MYRELNSYVGILYVLDKIVRKQKANECDGDGSQSVILQVVRIFCTKWRANDALGIQCFLANIFQELILKFFF